MNSPVFFRSSSRPVRRGFTLMEMLIVLSIIALLMGLVIMKLGGISGAAQRQKAQADILAYREALSTYQLDNAGTLPTTEQGLKALWSKPTTEPIPTRWHQVMDEEVKDPWGHSYQYLNPGKHNPERYDVFTTDPEGEAIGNWSDSTTSN